MPLQQCLCPVVLAGPVAQQDRMALPEVCAASAGPCQAWASHTGSVTPLVAR